MMAMVITVVITVTMMMVVNGYDKNHVYGPCWDTSIQRRDGFTLGLAFSNRESFFFNQTQLSPCDRRLNLASSTSKFAVFRPKVDEISLLTINDTAFSPDRYGGYMVAFAGRKYAARSMPTFIANQDYTITSFTLVLEFDSGTLHNFYWKQDGCASCSGKSAFLCINHTDCAIRTTSCKSHGGPIDCIFGIQLAFSGTDRNDAVLNSWYEVAHLKQYSLYSLYSDLRDSVVSQFNGVF